MYTHARAPGATLSWFIQCIRVCALSRKFWSGDSAGAAVVCAPTRSNAWGCGFLLWALSCVDLFAQNSFSDLFVNRCLSSFVRPRLHRNSLPDLHVLIAETCSDSLGQICLFSFILQRAVQVSDRLACSDSLAQIRCKECFLRFVCKACLIYNQN